MMCNQSRNSPWWLAALLGLLLLFVARTSWAQEMDAPAPMPNTRSSLQTPSDEQPNQTDWRAKLLELWTPYDQAFQGSMTSLDEFLSQVEAYGISFEDLPKYIEFLENSFKASEEARTAESLVAAAEIADKQAKMEKAERSRNTLIGIAIAELVAFIIALIL